MKTAQALNNFRFASCAGGFRLLLTLLEVAGRAVVGGMFLSRIGLKCCDDFSPGPINKTNLTRRGVCRGKIPLRKNQPTSKKGR
jgi:hypothetical protein